MLELVSHKKLSNPTAPVAACTYEVWDLLGRLVYVGVAEHFPRRWQQHEARSWWLGEIDVDRVDVTGWPTREDALRIEAAVINEQGPVYNTAPELAAYARYTDDGLRPLGAPVERTVYAGAAR